ncbi:MAG: hypothetical protein RIB84_08905 [Sneathiellaceae bacterium]
MIPFILRGCKKLPPEGAPSNNEVYDQHGQLWIDRESGEPLVCRIRTRVHPSQFGETTITETREGADQSEVSVLGASQFGETTITKTSEGVDQSEIAVLSSSRFGETTVTATLEGTDQTDAAKFHQSEFGETTITRTHEGHDQTEMTFSSVSERMTSDWVKRRSIDKS